MEQKAKNPIFHILNRSATFKCLKLFEIFKIFRRRFEKAFSGQGLFDSFFADFLVKIQFINMINHNKIIKSRAFSGKKMKNRETIPSSMTC